MHTTAWKSCPHLLLHFIEVYSRALSNGTRSSALMPWDRTWNRPTLCDMLGATSVKAVCPCVLLSVAWSRCTLLLTCMVMACLCSLSGFLSFFLSFFLFFSFFLSFCFSFFLSVCLSFFDPFFLFLLSFCISYYFFTLFFFSPTCQVRVSRFYQSCLPPSSSFFLPPPSSSFLLLPPPSSSFLLLPAPDLSGHCRTSTASSSKSQWALPDPNCKLRCIFAMQDVLVYASFWSGFLALGSS